MTRADKVKCVGVVLCVESMSALDECKVLHFVVGPTFYTLCEYQWDRKDDQRTVTNYRKSRNYESGTEV